MQDFNVFMGEAFSELNPSIKLGRSIKRVGLFQIINVIVGIFVVFAFLAIIVSIIISANSIDDAFNKTIRAIQIFVILTIIIQLILYYFLYQVHLALKNYPDDNGFFTPLLNDASKFMAFAILFGIITLIFSVIDFFNFIEEIRTLKDNNASLADYEDMLNEFRPTSVSYALLSIVSMGFIIYSMYHLDKWLGFWATNGEIDERIRFMYMDSKSNTKYLIIGYALLILTSLTIIIPELSILGLATSIGSILVIAGYYQVGSKLENLNLIQYAQINPIEKIGEQFCSQCGTKNLTTSKFCIKCGNQME